MSQDSGVIVGQCQGGPLDGKSAASRLPHGFVLVDKAAETIWVYQHNGTVFIVDDVAGEPYAKETVDNYAEGGTFDVLAWSAEHQDEVAR